MTAYVLSKQFPECKIVGLDRSERACELSTHLLRRADSSTISIRQADIGQVTDLTEFDSILVALNVGGSDQEKTELIRRIKRFARPDAVLLARTACGWSRVLYPSIDIPELNPEPAMEDGRPSYVRGVIFPMRISDLPD